MLRSAPLVEREIDGGKRDRGRRRRNEQRLGEEMATSSAAKVCCPSPMICSFLQHRSSTAGVPVFYYT